MIPVYARTQTQLLADIEALQRDTSNSRWSDAEIMQSVNRAVMNWGNRVLVPYVYEFSVGTTSNDRMYDLPSYVREPIDFEVMLSGTDVWMDIPFFSVMQDSGTTKTLQLDYYPPRADARVIWWAPNSRLPATAPTITTSSITASSTSVIVNAAVDIDDVGFVKIENEWLQYTGITLGTTTTTLNNLVRGVFGTTAASHNTAVTVAWGLAVHRLDLFEQLYDMVRSYLHEYFLTNAGNTEKELHQYQMRRFEQKANEFWRRYTPARSPKVILDRRGAGDPYSTGYSADRWPYRYP